MGFNKNIDGYPQQYSQLCERLWDDPTPITIVMESKGAATRLRFKFYDFKKALRLQTSDRGRELCRMAENTVVIVRDNTLEFSSRDHALDAIAIDAALVAMGNTHAHSPDAVQNELDRLVGNPIIPDQSPSTEPQPETQDSLLNRYF